MKREPRRTRWSFKLGLKTPENANMPLGTRNGTFKIVYIESWFSSREGLSYSASSYYADRSLAGIRHCVSLVHTVSIINEFTHVMFS